MRTEHKNSGFIIDRHIPLALIFSVLLQGAAVVWWASMMETKNHFRDERLQLLEDGHLRDSDKQELILQRLSRLEARSDAQMEILQRLDAQLARRK